jgi:hypothetical protein
MARVDLRLKGANVLEDLPPVCMCCGIDVSRFTSVHLAMGERTVRCSLPLCRRDFDAGKSMLESAFLNTTAAFLTAGGGLVGMLAEEVHRREIENAVHIPLSNVHPEFVFQLTRLRRKAAQEWEDQLIRGHPKAKQKTPPDDNASAFAGIDAADQRESPLRRRQPKKKAAFPVWLAVALVAGGLLLVAAVALIPILAR